MRNRCLAFWKSVSLPYPEDGIRLIPQDALEMVDRQMRTCQADLEASVAQLAHTSPTCRRPRGRLGDLYCERDYPASLDGLFAVSWDYPSLEVPSYLAQLNPARYEEECRRVAARFDEAVALTEQAFLDELAHLVTHLTERLSGTVDGSPRSSATRRSATCVNSSNGSVRSTSAPTRSWISWSTNASGSFKAWSRNSCATTSRCVAMWPPVCRPSSPCSMACSWIDHGARILRTAK